MRRILPFLCILFTVAVVSVYQRDSRVPLFPRQLSQSDIALAKTLLSKWDVPYAYDSASGTLFVTREARAKHLPTLVRVGIPIEPGFRSEIDGGEEIAGVLSAMLLTSTVKFENFKSGDELSIQSSWLVEPADISAVYRLLALYYPHLDLDEIRMKLDVGTDLAPESLAYYGLAGYHESNRWQKSVQEVLDELSPRKAVGLVTVEYEPPPPIQEDEMDDGDFSRYMLCENVQVRIYLDRDHFNESELGRLKEQVARASGMCFEQEGAITVHDLVDRGAEPRG